MSAFKPQQRHLVIRGRTFHFVAYEGVPANPRRESAAVEPMWYVMIEGRRLAVAEWDASQTEAQVDAALSAWAEEALGPADAAPARRAAEKPARNRNYENWWGPN